MSLSSRYTEAWESFWRETPDEPGAAIWDSPPELTAKPHLDLLRPHADVTLPVVDLGCGNGTQTRYLAGHFPRAVGVDLAPAAVEHARRADPEGTADFRCLDATDPAAIRALHDELGDVNVYLRAARELTHKLDHEPSPEEIANLLEKPVDEVKRMLGLNERVTSVDVSLGPDSDKTLLDTLTDDRPTDPCELLQDDDLSQSIDQWLSELTDKQREVVIRRFGLRGHESSTLEEVGQEIGLTRERVRQIQVEALKRLREILEKNGLSSDALFQ